MLKKAPPITLTSYLSNNAIQILESRYLQRDAKGNIVETPDEMFKRVAGAVAQAELKFGKKSKVNYWKSVFYKSMTALDFLPNSPTLMNTVFF